jgi:aminoglycoside phosphotransferase (APT) family kinase protein
MATIHDVAPPPIAGFPDEREQISRIVHEVSPNRHGSNPTPALWAKVGAALPRVSWTPNVLIHGDFHPGNVLFARSRLTAVVDWPLAAAGQPASDVGMCRLDAGMMLGLDVADMILAAYEAETGAPVADRGWWDLFAASRADGALDSWTESYVGLGPTDPTLETVTSRFDDFVAGALAAMEMA